MPQEESTAATSDPFSPAENVSQSQTAFETETLKSLGARGVKFLAELCFEILQKHTEEDYLAMGTKKMLAALQDEVFYDFCYPFCGSYFPSGKLEGL